MTGLRIIDCGAGTTLQDQGRFGFRRFGVSTSGFADNASAAFANALVGNPPFEACVEFQMAGGAACGRERTGCRRANRPELRA